MEKYLDQRHNYNFHNVKKVFPVATAPGTYEYNIKMPSNYKRAVGIALMANTDLTEDIVISVRDIYDIPHLTTVHAQLLQVANVTAINERFLPLNMALESNTITVTIRILQTTTQEYIIDLLFLLTNNDKYVQYPIKYQTSFFENLTIQPKETISLDIEADRANAYILGVNAIHKKQDKLSLGIRDEDGVYFAPVKSEFFQFFTNLSAHDRFLYTIIRASGNKVIYSLTNEDTISPITLQSIFFTHLLSSDNIMPRMFFQNLIDLNTIHHKK